MLSFFLYFALCELKFIQIYFFSHEKLFFNSNVHCISNCYEIRNLQMWTEVDIYRINKVSYLVVTVVYKLCKVAFPILRIIMMTNSLFLWNVKAGIPFTSYVNSHFQIFICFRLVNYGEEVIYWYNDIKCYQFSD